MEPFDRNQNGDERVTQEAQLIKLCASYRAHLQKYFLFRGVPASDVQDLVQDTFAVAWTRRDSIDIGKARHYLNGIARYMAMTYRRTQSLHQDGLEHRQRDVLHALYPKAGSSDPAGAPQKGMERLKDLVANLPARQAQLIQMVYFEGMTCSEAARTLNITRQAASKALIAALSCLQKALGSDE